TGLCRPGLEPPRVLFSEWVLARPSHSRCFRPHPRTPHSVPAPTHFLEPRGIPSSSALFPVGCKYLQDLRVPLRSSAAHRRCFLFASSPDRAASPSRVNVRRLRLLHGSPRPPFALSPISRSLCTRQAVGDSASR